MSSSTISIRVVLKAQKVCFIIIYFVKRIFLTIIVTKLIRNLLDLQFISAGLVGNGQIFWHCNSEQFCSL